MATREQVINKIKKVGYRFKRDAWRVSIFKKETHRISVPKRNIIADEWVVSTFRQAGIPNQEIEEFLRQCKN